MTNYEKYVGTPSRFAELIMQMNCEDGIGEALTRQFCLGKCINGDRHIFRKRTCYPCCVHVVL